MNTADLAVNLGTSPPPRLPRAAETPGGKGAPNPSSSATGLEDVVEVFPTISGAEQSVSSDSKGDLRAALQEAVDEANSRIKTLTNAAVRFKIDEETGRTVIEVVDRDTDEVIRNIPPEEMLRIASRLSNTGLVINSQG
ncbi:flagellar protein FlaG [Candidatus Sumerlaeota bacterium]|nr:flagellar protein FlaG [Candidatus Sumerlaeota bacterium]